MKNLFQRFKIGLCLGALAVGLSYAEPGLRPLAAPAAVAVLIAPVSPVVAVAAVAWELGSASVMAQTNTPAAVTSQLVAGAGSAFDSGLSIGLYVLGILIVIGLVIAGIRTRRGRGAV